ncbi:MAG: type II toxin-antitoxin system VapC family toxin [Prochloraceae cyanobacterium]|nr:type II toxin-antitoxin system VapC family toxin [Prochloraceae cyanobacterium]
MSKSVLDASALLAFLNKETRHERVGEAIANYVMSAVNMSETIAKLIEVGMPQKEIELVLAYLSCEVKSFELEDAIATAKLRQLTRSLGLSLGDRACLALGVKLGLTVLTADRAWSSLTLGIPIEIVRS